MPPPLPVYVWVRGKFALLMEQVKLFQGATGLLLDDFLINLGYSLNHKSNLGYSSPRFPAVYEISYKI